jgi:hypothetical protein
MAIVLGANQYGKAEVRLLHVSRDDPADEITDLNHFEVDMSPFGLENQGDVFYAADRPYGLIAGTVNRDDAPAPGKAW